jgi:hypothetical protein
MRPHDVDVAVYMGNEEKALVEFIGVVNLPLATPINRCTNINLPRI